MRVVTAPNGFSFYYFDFPQNLMANIVDRTFPRHQFGYLHSSERMSMAQVKSLDPSISVTRLLDRYTGNA